MSEFANEPVPGLPERLPEGEHILWQGAPHWWSLARRALHIRKVALYFGALLLWSGAASLAEGGSATVAIASALGAAPVALLGLGLLALLAWLTARTTVYTITNKRVVMRIGIALPIAVNIPFRIVGSAALLAEADKAGDISLSLTGNGRMSYLHLWPHARPWRVSRPQPTLRAIPDVVSVAEILSRALALAHSVPPQAVGAARPPLPQAASLPPEAVAA